MPRLRANGATPILLILYPPSLGRQPGPGDQGDDQPLSEIYKTSSTAIVAREIMDVMRATVVFIALTVSLGLRQAPVPTRNSIATLGTLRWGVIRSTTLT